VGRQAINMKGGRPQHRKRHKASIGDPSREEKNNLEAQPNGSSVPKAMKKEVQRERKILKK
jgi:hypothetical protein